MRGEDVAVTAGLLATVAVVAWLHALYGIAGGLDAQRAWMSAVHGEMCQLC